MAHVFSAALKTLLFISLCSYVGTVSGKFVCTHGLPCLCAPKKDPSAPTPDSGQREGKSQREHAFMATGAHKSQLGRGTSCCPTQRGNRSRLSPSSSICFLLPGPWGSRRFPGTFTCFSEKWARMLHGKWERGLLPVLSPPHTHTPWGIMRPRVMCKQIVRSWEPGQLLGLRKATEQLLLGVSPHGRRLPQDTAPPPVGPAGLVFRLL